MISQEENIRRFGQPVTGRGSTWPKERELISLSFNAQGGEILRIQMQKKEAKWLLHTLHHYLDVNRDSASEKLSAPANLSKTDAAAVRGSKGRLPELPDELYEYYPAMSAQTHEKLVKSYARDAIRAPSADPAQAGFANADWYYRDNDPDDNGDTAYEAIVNHPEYSIHLVHSSYRGDSRYVFRAPTLDPSDDDDEVLNFETEEEAIAAATERKEAIASLPAAPTTVAGR
ncbi:hypothetical protein [Paenochrobactrum pullorum]|uniref:hypothetical protein n=1 Tax=Paenochrobactrum pullorum TaxID=1324351 RepID=UPI0035BBAEBD